MRDAKYGVLMHFLADRASETRPTVQSSEEWNSRVDAFDVDGLARQLQAVGAGYFFITIGQNSGFYLSPNDTYERIVGAARNTRCSRRDLVADLSDALEPRGIRLCVYLPAAPPKNDAAALAAFGEDRRSPEGLLACQRLWDDVCREWSLRWGRKISAWWLDGVADPQHRLTLLRGDNAPNFTSFAAALRAGNPDVALAFNTVIEHMVTTCEEEDYSAGEITCALPVADWRGDGQGVLHRPCTPLADGRSPHVLGFLGEFWGRGEPSLPTELVVGYTKYVNRCGGAVTWDAPFLPTGLLTDSAVEQLAAIRSSSKPTNPAASLASSAP